MEFIENFFLSDALHVLSQGLVIPTAVLLILLAAYTVYTLGSLVVEVVVERRHYKVVYPRFLVALNRSSYNCLSDVVDTSGLLESQIKILHELVSYMYLPADAYIEVAKRLLSEEKKRYKKALFLTDAAAKIAPMLGLMGTLIPLGPGIVALSSGDLDTLSSSLLMAFDTTVAGLSVAVVCYVVTKIRKGWYSDYLDGMESAMNTILEKASILQAEGFDFSSYMSVDDFTVDEEKERIYCAYA